MPGTTRYSATFDRTYEEEDRVDSAPPPNARRSRSQSCQLDGGGRPYTPLGLRPPNQRSSSTDNGPTKGPEHIPTRTVGRTAVKAHSNPFQFVKVGTCPLYKKAEEQLKKVKEVKKPDVLKEEEEEWQSNLDSWKSRRRKMSEDVFRRAEEVRQFELEEQINQLAQKKTKTFSEMVEQRATRGRALSLCLISSPMELQNWEFEGSHKNGSCSTFSGESEENSTVNSEDEGVSLKGLSGKSENGTHTNHRTNGDSHIEKNGSDSHNGDYNKLSDLESNLQLKPKEGSYIDSGLESISSHRAGDTPDSGSDFSHDSGSSIDCDSPRTGVNLLEEFSSKSSQISSDHVVTNGTTNGFSISEKNSECAVKADKSELSKPKSESVQYEKSIESENEMFVDDYEELQRQSELLAASKMSEIHSQANGNISATSVNGMTPNITLPKISPVSKLKSDVPKGSVDVLIKREPDHELGSEMQKNDDTKLKNKTRRKGVYALNVSAAPNQICKEGISVNSLFPLSPVTELPSPEDAKTMASTLSSNLTSVSDSKKENVAKSVSKEACTEQSSSIKEKLNPTATVTESGILNKISSEDTNVIPKVGAKSDSAVTPSSPTVGKPKDKNAVLVSPQSEKPKLVLKKVKKKKVVSSENETSKESSTNLPSLRPVDVSLKKEEKDAFCKESKAVSQEEEKLADNVKTEIKQKNAPKSMENIPDKTVTESIDSKCTTPNNVEKDSNDKKKTDSVIIPSTEIAENKLINTTSKSLQGEELKPSLGPKKVKIKIKKANTSETTPAASLKQSTETPSSSITNATSNLSSPVNKLTEQTKSTVTNKEKKVYGTIECKKVTGINECKKIEPSMECKAQTTSTIAAKSTSTIAEKPTNENKISIVSSDDSIQHKDVSTLNDQKAALKKLKDGSMKPPSPSVSNGKTPSISSNKETKSSVPVTHEKPVPSIALKKIISKPKENNNFALSTKVVCDTERTEQPQNSPSASCNAVLAKDNDMKYGSISNEDVTTKKDAIKQQSENSQDANQTSTCKKNKTKTRKKNSNSQKVNTPAKQIEECKNLSVDSLNVIFQSEPKQIKSENQSNVKNSEIKSSDTVNIDLVPDVPPVEKVAEEMEKLILEQLEEEERAKELASGMQTKSLLCSPEHLLTAPPKLAEPPKEKPPPPPATVEGDQKDTSLKRVNSTKRIKKEIYKRRSNFLGIDNADENLTSNEPSIPPPPALEEILKAEMELDRQSRLKIESESTERLTLEEKEIMQKEREIIESLESEERRKQLINCSKVFNDITPSDAIEMLSEEEHILLLKTERKRLEAERLMAEEQQLHLIEEKQLREREEFIRKQEAGKSPVLLSDNSFSVPANAPNTSEPSLPSLSTDTQSNGSLSGALGDGNSLTSISSHEKSAESSEKEKVVPQKPAVPPKPLKKKEAIRKERERLRQEQEALQREREEHRRKLMQEQEELLKQKSHAPEAPVASRLGPLPPLVPPPLTTTNPHARDSASFPSRSHHGAPNGAAGSNNTAELMGPAVVRQKIPPRKVVQTEAWGQQKDSGKGSPKSVPPVKVDNLNKPSPETSSTPKSKEKNVAVKEDVMGEQKVNDETGNGKQKKGGRKVRRIVKKKIPSVRKQNQDSLTESRYNQNHWLIQEAEMRRISELKERQRPAQLSGSQTCLAEDDVCSNPPRVPVNPSSHNQNMNYHTVQDKMCYYPPQHSVPIKKYPPPVVKEPLHTIYPRETVSQQPPMKPSRVVPMERQEQMLSVSGRKRCSHCNEELGHGAAMIIESLQLYYHINCFQCCVCHAQLGNGSCGADVRVRNKKLHCNNCYSNDEAGLKFSQV